MLMSPHATSLPILIKSVAKEAYNIKMVLDTGHHPGLIGML